MAILTKKLEARLLKDSKNIGAISVVDFGGNSVEIDEISSLAKKYNIPLIDDASHALGALYKSEKVGKKPIFLSFLFILLNPSLLLKAGLW